MNAEKLWSIAAIVALFFALAALEQLAPLRRRNRPLAHRLAVNAVIAALALATAFAIVVPVTTATLSHVTDQRFGLLHWFAMPAAAQFVLGFLLLDLSFYGWHLANHKIPFLWHFHNAHHIDP